MAYVLVKDRIWPSIGYDPHTGQQTIHHSLARHRVAACGRRFGKSTVGGHELTVEAMNTYMMLQELRAKNRARRFWIVGPDYDDTAKEFREVWGDLERLGMPLDRPGSTFRPEAGNMRVSMFDGKFEIETKSARHPESMDGEGLSGVVLVEAAKLKTYIWGKYIRPALADFRGWSLHTGVPEGKNQFYEKWQYGQDPEYPDWESWRMPAWINPNVYPGGRHDPEIIAMERDMSAEAFGQEIEANFTDFVGRVFKTFDEEIHVKDLEYDRTLPLYGACDYGWTNPFVWLAIQVDVYQNVYVIGEYRTVQTDINDIGDALAARPMFANARQFFPDPSRPDDTAVLEKRLRIPANTSTGGEKKHRIELIRKQLKLDPESEGHPEETRKPKLIIDRRCYGLIQEMLDYRYPATKEESLKALPEEPLDKDDHGPEALGRFFRGFFGGPGEDGTRGRPRVKRAVIRSG
jgi:hypothetical protein